MPSFARDPGNDTTSIYDMFQTQNDTKVFWVRAGNRRRLGLYQRDFYKEPTLRHETGGDRHLSPFEVSQNAVENAKRPYEFVSYVPIEFESVAVALHQSEWGSAPLERDAKTPAEIAQASVTI